MSVSRKHVMSLSIESVSYYIFVYN